MGGMSTAMKATDKRRRSEEEMGRGEEKVERREGVPGTRKEGRHDDTRRAKGRKHTMDLSYCA